MNSSETQGLCMTCNYAGDCVYLANAISPVWRCEEFYDGPAVATLKTRVRTDESEPVTEPLVVAGAYARTA